ncbi:4-oxalomesaconate tautomerase [Actinoplanes sp. CA-015351]|uniref:4-oxalomesaconate tautomerase n=1 Tax=Actinoplanes sp. CA-015351 TaxID=3239897 RepID=UPI003D95FE35
MAGVPVLVMRGGTSKGAYFLASDLPKNPEIRDELLLRIMGSPDPRQIDGIGGGHPLTSKVAVVSASPDPDADVDYLFLQVHVDRPLVSAEQPCGNILAGVGPFALERGLVVSHDHTARVRVRMVNTGALATVHVPVADGRPVYSGDTAISGVPGTASRLLVEFHDLAGSVTGALFPTGNRVDQLDGIRATLIDNGMPVVLIEASSLGITGHESPTRLEYHETLRDRIEKLRLLAGDLMGLGDVRDQTVPKMCLVAPPIDGGSLCTRMFIPHRVHGQIGVLAAASVGAAAALRGTVAAGVLSPAPRGFVRLEHPTGWFDVDAEMDTGRTAIVSTARLLLDGIVHPR